VRERSLPSRTHPEGKRIDPELGSSETLRVEAAVRTVVRKVLRHACETATTHNARHQRGPHSRRLSASVPRVRGSVIASQAIFLAKSDDGGGLKNRRLAECKISIGQVLISRTLSVYGEVAEWPKAAVC
jgi:hypothetical protein